MARTSLDGYTISARDSVVAKLANIDATFDSLTSIEDVVLATSPGPTLDAAVGVHFCSTTGTVAGVLPDGVFVGQSCEIVQSVAASTPVGTITGAFKNQAGVAKGTLALGTAVGDIFRGSWDGAHWRQVATLGGTSAALS